MDYWREHAEIAMDEAELSASDDQLDTIAGVIESAHEFYDQAMGHDVADRNLQGEKDRRIQDLKQQVADEKAKVACRNCNATGKITDRFGTFESTSDCFKCHGDGRV